MRPEKFERRREDAPKEMRKQPRPPALDRERGEAILAEVKRALEGSGFALIRGRAFPNWQLRIMIERAGGEIPTVGDCEQASRVAQSAVQAAGADPGQFEFEVESPGADRPLTRPEDFVRFAGEQVTVTLFEAREGRRNFTGRLIGEKDGDVTVHVLDETEPQTFAKTMIREARLHPEMKFKPAEEDERRGGSKRGKRGRR